MRDQAEYRQWRRSVQVRGEEEDTVETIVSSLWEELFSEPLGGGALAEDDSYDEVK